VDALVVDLANGLASGKMGTRLKVLTRLAVNDGAAAVEGEHSWRRLQRFRVAAYMTLRCTIFHGGPEPWRVRRIIYWAEEGFA
jgi:hypothetical protein